MSDSGKSDSSQAEDRDIWEEIDRRFERTLRYAERAYVTNYYINLIIVAIGIILLGSSIYFSWREGLNPSTLAYAGLGIADFVALFLVNPQTRIQQLVGDLDQILVIYRTWRDQLYFLNDYANAMDWRLTFEERVAYNAELNKIEEQALSALETYIGSTATAKAGGRGTEKTSQGAQEPGQTEGGDASTKAEAKKGTP